MNASELFSKVDFFNCHCGCYRIIISFRGKSYSCYSNNSRAVDTLYEWSISSSPLSCNHVFASGLTLKQSLLSLYNECKLKNNLL